MHVIKNSYKLLADLLQGDRKKDSHHLNGFGVGYCWGKGGRNGILTWEQFAEFMEWTFSDGWL